MGWYMCQHLADIFGKEVVHPINVGLEPRDKKKFVNAKAEYFWGLRMRIQDGELSGITDERLIGQLTAIRYKHNPKGQIAIEGKDELMKRGIRSPDLAEALMLVHANAQGPSNSLFRLESIPRDEGGYFGDAGGEVSLERPSPWRMS